MSVAEYAAPRDARRTVVVYAAALGLVALGAIGSILTLRTSGGHTADHVGSGSIRQAETAFGAIAVTDAERLVGLAARDLAGLTHGVQSLVGPRQARVDVTLVVTNRTGRSFTFEPGTLRLLGPKGGVYPAQHATTQQAVLPAGASLETRVGFVAPRTATEFTLEYTGPGGDRSRLALGVVPAVLGAGDGDSGGHGTGQEDHR